MKDPESRTVLAGVDGRTDTELPDWYCRKKTVDEARSFAEAVRDLPQAVETTVAYQNPYTDEWVETDRFNAIVEPTRVREHATDDEPDVDPLFHVPTDSYAIINPVDVYRPLEDVLREETIDGTPLGDVMFGEIRRYRGGGEVHMDVMFDGLEVRLPGRSEPITIGVTSGYDFFGEHAVYVEGFAQDGYCSNSMRSLMISSSSPGTPRRSTSTSRRSHSPSRSFTVCSDSRTISLSVLPKMPRRTRGRHSRSICGHCIPARRTR